MINNPNDCKCGVSGCGEIIQRCKAPESPKPATLAEKYYKCHCGNVLSQEMIDYQIIKECSCGREFKFVKGLTQPSKKDHGEEVLENWRNHFLHMNCENEHCWSATPCLNCSPKIEFIEALLHATDQKARSEEREKIWNRIEDHIFFWNEPQWEFERHQTLIDYTKKLIKLLERILNPKTP